MIVGTKTDAHSLRSQLGIGSESDYFLGQLDRIFHISDSEARVKEKSGGVVGEELSLRFHTDGEATTAQSAVYDCLIPYDDTSMETTVNYLVNYFVWQKPNFVAHYAMRYRFA